MWAQPAISAQIALSISNVFKFSSSYVSYRGLVGQREVWFHSFNLLSLAVEGVFVTEGLRGRPCCTQWLSRVQIPGDRP